MKNYVICVAVEELMKKIKIVDIAKGKGRPYILSISPKVDKDGNQMIMLLANDTLAQASSMFSAPMHIIEVDEEGNETVCEEEKLEEIMQISLSSDFKKAVEAFSSITEQLIFIINEKKVTVVAGESRIELAIMDKVDIVPTPKDKEKATVSVNRLEAAKLVKYVGVASDMADDKITRNLRMRIYSEDKTYLQVYGPSSYVCSCGKLPVTKISKNTMPGITTAFGIFSVDRLRNVFFSLEEDEVKLTFYYEKSEEGAAPGAVCSLVIICGNDKFQFAHFSTSALDSVLNTVLALPDDSKKLIVDSKSFMSALSMASIGTGKSTRGLLRAKDGKVVLIDENQKNCINLNGAEYSENLEGQEYWLTFEVFAKACLTQEGKITLTVTGPKEPVYMESNNAVRTMVALADKPKTVDMSDEENSSEEDAE